ncbi:MGH1-like glycoside hydrolase domain-containing protein [Acuticoccus mangrovi]|uniref:Mannosylglycerate hydrolase MGH1-like glycoside hydrolase domain-containing protein n=1 Tax=Acuticoccus mangrovi TaxID=2796142 RepID=A0A934IEJ2_9HYPH|nr:hypothetical protein [Acuticoccus mangrovi]MBJ3775144.1 hypothetical protein [Acuticoccus mangrovi]
MMASPAERDTEAAAILAANDRGGFSVPTKGLYPFQWNWDSAFAAMGYAHASGERAVQELQSLVAGQWPNGMIPHIIFHRPDPGYFPGPEVWETAMTPPTSGITQPPVLAIAIAALADRGVLAGERLADLLEAADRSHAFFFEARRDPATNVVGVVHPWESGRDNMPDWDDALAAVDASKVKPFVRRDTSHIDAAMRPTKEQYERYIALVEFGIAVGWDQRRIMVEGPFFVGDPGIAAVLVRAERELQRLARTIGRDDLGGNVDVRLPALCDGLEALWSDALGAYTTLDLRTGKRGEAVSSASFLPFAAGVVDAAQTERLNAHFDRLAARCRYMVPSYDPDAPTFDEKRYWRGPVWLVVNWLIALGLAETGDAARAERVRGDSRALVEAGGFYEYFSPLTGAPLGGADFTWTAAAWLDFARGTDG